MSVGTTRTVAKTALITLLQARNNLSQVAVNYAEPKDATDVVADNGTRSAIWLAGATGDVTVPAMRGGGIPELAEETYVIALVCQAIAADSDSGQSVTDARVDALYAEILDVVTSTPALGVTGYMRFEATMAGWADTTEQIGPHVLAASRLNVGVRIVARPN